MGLLGKSKEIEELRDELNNMRKKWLYTQHDMSVIRLENSSLDIRLKCLESHCYKKEPTKQYEEDMAIDEGTD